MGRMGKVYINGREAVHKDCGGRAIAFPDVCLCPPGPPSGPVPVPLTNTVQAKDLVNGALTVTIEGNRMGHSDSYFATSTGNEVARSTGGGVISHAVQGKAYFATSSPNVLIEGKPAVRHGDLLTQNHLAKMPGNTPPSVWMSSMLADGPTVAPKKYTKVLNEGKEWISFEAEDKHGKPSAYRAYRLTTPAGTALEGRTLLEGVVTVKRIAKGRCKLEWLDDPSCKEKGDASRSRPSPWTKPHEVKQGECLESIAHRAGLSWEALWDHPSNAGLKQLRKNPNVLFPGDLVQIPDGEPQPFLIETGKTHTFVLSRSESTRLDVVLMHDGKPRADEECTVSARGMRNKPATTDGKGRLTIDLPAKTKHVSVRMDLDDFTFELDLGHVDPIDTVAGVQGRLLALGNDCGEDDGVLGMAARQAIFRFRRDNGLPPGVEIDDALRGKLQAVFGA